MSINGEVQKFNPDALIVLYELYKEGDTENIFRFHAGVNELNGNLVS